MAARDVDSEGAVNMGRSYWLDLFSGSSWEEFLAAGGRVSGFRPSLATVKKIAPGDWLLCYVTGVSRWIGILEVTGESFTSEERIWADDVFPARLPVKVVLQLDPENSVPITLLRDKLSYFKSESPTAWTGHFRRSPARIKADDAEVIVEALEAAKANPESRPLSRSKWARRIPTVTAPDEQEVAVPVEDAEATPESNDVTMTTHDEIQHMLLKLGNEMGFDLWLARNDRSRTFAGRVLGQMPGVRASLPTQFDPATSRTIELIDVLWLKGNAIIAAFEVEHTTSVYSGLLRMADLIAMQPGITIRLYIVAPDERRGKVLGEIARPVFSRMEPPLRERCQFIPYSELKQKEEQVRGLTQYLKPEFLDEIAESAD